MQTTPEAVRWMTSAALALVTLSGCGTRATPAETAPATTAPGGALDAGLADASEAAAPPPEALPGCNPIVGDDCLTPFPSSFYETPDPTSATGVRVSVPVASAPVQSSGKPISPARLNQKDGFSPASPLLVYFAAGVDGSALFSWKDPSPSLKADSPVQIVDYDTGARVLAFAELDANAGGGRQALIVHPLQRLQPAKRYVVALVGLKDASGAPLAPAPFRALRDGTPLSSSLAPLKPRYDEIFAKLAAAGVDRGALTLAWDVVTASDGAATSHLVGMRDTAFAMAQKGQLSYSIVSTNETPSDPDRLREIQATIKVPSFLADDSGTSMMTFGPDGQPAMRAVVNAPIVIEVPQCAATATAPLPVIVFGHGLFGTALATLDASAIKKVANQYCGVFIGTDWIGLATPDVTNLANLLGADLNNLYVATDRLQQAHVNAQTMTRLFLTTIKDDPALAVNGKPVTDGKQVYYFGVSNGGIQGTTFMGLTPDVVRGVLNVPGGEWSMLISRSVDFDRFRVLLLAALSDPLDQQVALAMSQSEWDYTDALTFAPHLLSNPLPGAPVKRILVQESIDDAQVANIATRVLARTMGLPSVDLTEPVPGLQAATSPLDSAYTQWDSHPAAVPPMTNTALTADNGAHDAVWQSAKAIAQVSAFCQPTGQVISTCGGPCSTGP